MARRHSGTSNKKTFNVEKREGDLVENFMQAAGKPSISAVLAEMIEAYLEYGTDYKAPEMVSLQTIVDPDILMRAEERARGEDTNLRDVIRYEINQLDFL